MSRGTALALALALVACATPPVGVDATGEPPSISWRPPASPRAIIVALHGFNDFKHAFDELGRYAAERGVLVHAYDQRGFGERPDRGFWPGAVALVADLHDEVRAQRAAHPGVPLFVLGESMGAAVAALAYTDAAAPPIDGLILVAPAVWGGDSLSVLYRSVLGLAVTILPGLKVSGGGLGIQASDNLPMLRALGQDPLYIHETRLDAVAGLVELMDATREIAPRLEAPLLVLTGARDQVVPPEAQASFVAALPPERCTVISYLDGWHLLLRDLQREKVFADLLAWLDAAPPPSGLWRRCGPATMATAG